MNSTAEAAKGEIGAVDDPEGSGMDSGGRLITDHSTEGDSGQG